MKVRGLRGATTANANTEEDIFEATRELLEEMVRANDLDTDDIASAYFSTTRDLDAAFPPTAARVQMGWTDVAMMCGNEMDVAGGQPRCIRVMILINTDKRAKELNHVYLRDAANLRSHFGRQG